MSDIKWIKVAVDMFEDNKIEFIRSLPEGDAIIVTWIQMMSIAGQSNMGGYLMVTDGIPYTEQLLSNKLRRQPVFLQFALETLTKLRMINVDDGPIHITNWEKHQSIDGMERAREKTRNRVAQLRKRNKEKLLLTSNNDKVTLLGNDDVTLHVTHGNAIEVEEELDKEKDTTLLDSQFEKVRREYTALHKVLDFPYRDSPLLTNMIAEGFTADLIVGVMKERYKPSVRTFRYYEGAIRDSNIYPRTDGTVKGPKQEVARQKRDAELLSRDREIAFNKHMQAGGDPNDFEY